MIAEEVWLIEPSGPLRGDVEVRGSKNGVSKHMVAAMLGNGESSIHNAPEVGEVEITAAMLRALGINVDISRTEIRIEQGPEIEPRVPAAFTGLNRIPILMLGPSCTWRGRRSCRWSAATRSGGGR